MADKKVRVEFEGDVSDLETKLSGVFDKFGVEAGESLSKGVEEGADRAVEVTEEAAASIEDSWEEAFEKAGQSAADAADEAGSSFDGLSDSVGREAKDAAKAAEDGLSGIPDAADSAADGAGKAFDSLPGEVGGSARDAAREAGDALDGMAGDAAKAGADAGSAAASGFDGIGDAARQAGASASEAFSDIPSAAETSAGQAGNAFSRIADAIRSGLSSAGETAGGVFSKIAEMASQAASTIKGSFSGIGSAVGGQLQEIGNNMSGAFSAGHDAGQSLPPIFGQIGGAILGVVGPAKMLRGGFDRLMDIQKAEILFKNIGLSAEQTGAQMDQLSDQVTGTSVSLSDAASVSAAMAQAGVELGGDMNNAIDAFTALSAAAMGSEVDITGVMKTVAAQGKVTLQEINRLSDGGVNATAWLSESMGIGMDEVRDAVSRGEVSFEQFVEAVNMGAGDLAQEMGTTLPAKLGNLKTAVSNLGANLIKPFIPLATLFVTVGTEIIKWLVKPIQTVTGFLSSGTPVATAFSAALTAIAAAAALFAGTVIIPFLAGIVSQLVTQSALVKMMIPMWGLLKKAMVSAFVTSPIGWVVAAIIGLVLVFRHLWKTSEGFRDFWIGLWERVTAPVKAAIDQIKGAWDGLVGIFRGEATEDGVGSLARLIGADKVAWIIDKVTTVKQVWEDLKTAFSGGDVEGGGALSLLIGMDRAERVMEIVGNIKGAWEDLKAAVSGGEGSGDALKAIFGEDMGGAIFEIFQKIGDAARILWDHIKQVGSALREAGESINGAAWEVVKTVFSALVDIGKALWDVLKIIVGAVMDLWNALAPLLLPILKLIGGIIIGTIVVAFFLLIGALKLVAGIFKFLGTVISWVIENVFAPLIEVIGNVITWFVEHLGGMVEWIVEKFTGLVEFFTSTGEGISEAWTGVWEWMQEVWDTYGQPVVDFITDAFLLLLGTLILLVFEPLKAAWNAVWEWITQAWAAYGQPVVDWVINAFNWMKDGLTAAWDWVKQKFTELWQWAQSQWQAYGQPVVDWIVDAYNYMQTWIGSHIARIRGWLTSFGQGAMELWNKYVQPMVDFVVNGFNKIKDKILEWKDKALNALSDVGTWLVQAGKDLVQGFINGIKEWAGKITAPIKDFASNAISTAKSALGINSPSRVFRDIGRDVGQGFVQGIERSANSVKKAAQKMADGVASVSVPDIPAPSVAAAAAPVVAAAPVAAAPVSVMAAPAAAPRSSGVQEEDGGSGGLEAMGAVGEGATALAESLDASISGLAVPVLNSLGTAADDMALVHALPSLASVGASAMATAGSAVAPAGSLMQSVMGQTGVGFLGAANGQINPALNSVSTTVWGVLNGGVIPATNGMVGAVNHTANAFGVAARSIATQWNQVREGTAQPVRFVISSVFNNGLVGMWNSVSDMLGTKKMNTYPVGFHSGGVLPGYTPGRDPYTFVEPNTGMSIGLSGGEAIMRPEVTRALGTSRVDSLNSAARMGGVGAVRRTLGEFNSGGIIGSITNLVRRYFPGMTITSTLRRGDPGYHGRGMAVDFSNGTDTTPGMQAAARFFHQNYGPGLAELIHYPLRGWQNIKNGRPLNYGAVTNQQHRNHVHIASTRPLGPPGMPIVPFAGGGDGGEFMSPAEIIAQMIKPHTDKMKAALGNRPRSGGFIDDLPVKVHDKMLESAKKSMEKAWETMSAFGGEVDGSLGMVERWRSMVIAALARNGFEPNLRNQNLMLAQIRSESGGNPGITQQIRDVNSGGNEAVGLLQVIPGTFAAYRDPALPNDRRDPWANMNAALRYYKARYGMDLGRMWGRGHGYHEGGLMPEGQGWFQKTAIAPERVLSPSQTANFEILTQALTRYVGSPQRVQESALSGGQTILVEINVDGAREPEKVAETVRDELFKAVR